MNDSTKEAIHISGVFIVISIILCIIITALLIEIRIKEEGARLLTENNILIGEIYTEQKKLNKKIIQTTSYLNSVFGYYLKMSGLDKEEISRIISDVDNSICRSRKEY